MDRIEIQGLEVECVIGVRPHERHRAQRVIVDVELGTELAAAGRSGRLDDTCDYDIVAQQVRELLVFRRYELLETAAEELSAMLFAVQPPIERLALRIAKPDALSGAGAAAVRVERARSAYPPREEATPGGLLSTWLVTHQAKLQTLHLGGAEAIATPRDWLGSAWSVQAWLCAGRLQHRGRWYTAASRLTCLTPLGADLGSDTGGTLFVCAVSAQGAAGNEPART